MVFSDEARFGFQSDNSPVHTAQTVKNWMEDHEVQLEKWPPRSPNLNPIENIWAIMKQKIAKLETRPKTLSELEIAVNAAWNEIQLDTVKNLYRSMPRRISCCLHSRGSLTKY